MSIFLTIEGIEGVGKSTAVGFIRDFLIKKNKEFLLTREPGGTPVAEMIRKILLNANHEEKILSETELLLMFASRAQHIQHIILPALQQNKWVVSDRFVDASYAYQGGGRNLNIAYIEMLEKWIVAEVKPTLTILLDAPPDIGLRRAKDRGASDRIEQEKIDFFERVRNGYLTRAAKDTQRFRVIDATQPIEIVHDNILLILQQLMATCDNE